MNNLGCEKSSASQLYDRWETVKMKKITIIRIVIILIITASPLTRAEHNTIHMPYRTLNVNEDYISSHTTNIISASRYLNVPPSSHISVSDQSNIFNTLLSYDNRGNIVLIKNIDSSIFNKLNTFYPRYKNDPNQILCMIKINSSDNEDTALLPLLINNGLRAKSVTELIDQYIDPTTGQIKSNGRDYLEISAKPSVFNTH